MQISHRDRSFLGIFISNCHIVDHIDVIICIINGFRNIVSVNIWKKHTKKTVAQYITLMSIQWVIPESIHIIQTISLFDYLPYISLTILYFKMQSFVAFTTVALYWMAPGLASSLYFLKVYKKSCSRLGHQYTVMILIWCVYHVSLFHHGNWLHARAAVMSLSGRAIVLTTLRTRCYRY